MQARLACAEREYDVAVNALLPRPTGQGIQIAIDTIQKMAREQLAWDYHKVNKATEFFSCHQKVQATQKLAGFVEEIEEEQPDIMKEVAAACNTDLVTVQKTAEALVPELEQLLHE